MAQPGPPPAAWQGPEDIKELVNSQFTKPPCTQKSWHLLAARRPARACACRTFHCDPRSS